MERELRLLNLSLYDGKHFWHCPGNEWRPIADAAIETAKALEIERAETTRINGEIRRLQAVIDNLQNSVMVRLRMLARRFSRSVFRRSYSDSRESSP